MEKNRVLNHSLSHPAYLMPQEPKHLHFGIINCSLPFCSFVPEAATSARLIIIPVQKPCCLEPNALLPLRPGSLLSRCCMTILLIYYTFCCYTACDAYYSTKVGLCRDVVRVCQHYLLCSPYKSYSIVLKTQELIVVFRNNL